MTDITVPFTGVTFFDGVDLPPSAGLTFVGAAPYVDTADGDTSYAQMDPETFPVCTAVYYRTPYVPPGTVASARFDIQVFVPEGDADPATHLSYGTMVIEAPPYDTGFYWNFSAWWSFPVGVWASFSFPLIRDSDLPVLLSRLAAGDEIRFKLQPSNSTAPCRISMMNLVLTVNDAPLPLRQFQRDDGLVGSTFRHGGGTSRQGSIRQLGYY